MAPKTGIIWALGPLDAQGGAMCSIQIMKESTWIQAYVQKPKRCAPVYVYEMEDGTFETDAVTRTVTGIILEVTNRPRPHDVTVMFKDGRVHKGVPIWEGRVGEILTFTEEVAHGSWIYESRRDPATSLHALGLLPSTPGAS